MQIEILSVNVNTVPTAKGSYQVAEVAYKDEAGKVSGKKVMSFTNKGVFEVICKAQQGNIFDVDSSKDDKGYWQWNHVKPATHGAASTSNAPTPTPRNNYETPEERKQRQDYIIRQSSLSTAVALLKTEKSVPSPEEVEKVAEQFVKFVYNKADSFASIEQMEDDIPY